MNIVVLGGAGDMGSHVVRDLIEHTQAMVTVADYRKDLAEKLAAQLGPRAKAAFVDATDEASLVSALKGADAAVGCVGPFYKFAPAMARAAIAAGVNYVDICDDYGPMRDLFAMHGEAQARRVTLVTGLGWTPGMSNLCARLGASKLDAVDSIKVAWVGGSGDSSGLAVVKHVFYAITGEVPTYRHGQTVNVPALAGKESVEFPAPLGRVEVFDCGHPEPLTIPRYIKAHNVSLKGALIPKWNDQLAALFVKLGLTKTPGRIDALARFVHSIEDVFRTGGAIPLSGLRVDVIGTKNGQPRTYSYLAADRMGRLTSIPAAVGAVMLASGQIEDKGVFAPEGVIEPKPFLAELEKRGVRVTEAVR